MNKFRKIRFFNMIEVTLAIGILAVGATAVLALFPLGMSKERDSIGENYCSEAASDFSAYIKTMALADWDGLLNSLPEVKTDISNDHAITDFTNWTPVDLYAVSDDIFTTETQGIYGLKKETNGLLDFAGEALIWRTDIEGINNSNISIGVFIEISWPASRKYSFRKKNYYYFELYNYNYQD